MDPSSWRWRSIDGEGKREEDKTMKRGARGGGKGGGITMKIWRMKEFGVGLGQWYYLGEKYTAT